jgi:hypothetical protein
MLLSLNLLMYVFYFLLFLLLFWIYAQSWFKFVFFSYVS